MTPRSVEPLDFTTFGELGHTIKTNWQRSFGAILSSVKAVEKIMANLNTLRGPIAHCSPLAEDEIVRLRLSVRDWFRLMGASLLGHRKGPREGALSAAGCERARTSWTAVSASCPRP